MLLEKIGKIGGSTASGAMGSAEVPEQQQAAAPVTTLCLWEPNADLMIRKAQGWERARRSEYAAEARKGAAQEMAVESGVSEEIKAFEERFALELRAAKDTMDEVVALTAADANTPKLFDWWLEQLTELHTYVSSGTSFLPTQLRQRFGKQIAEHEAALKAQRERLTPKKKFAFKKRDKVVAKPAAPPEAAPPPPAPTAAPPTAAAATTTAAVAPGAATGTADGTCASSTIALPTGGGVAHVPKADSFAAPAGCHGFRQR
jgi:hypothetical protein